MHKMLQIYMWMRIYGSCCSMSKLLKKFLYVMLGVFSFIRRFYFYFYFRLWHKNIMSGHRRVFIQCNTVFDPLGNFTRLPFTLCYNTHSNFVGIVRFTSDSVYAIDFGAAATAPTDATFSVTVQCSSNHS